MAQHYNSDDDAFIGEGEVFDFPSSPEPDTPSESDTTDSDYEPPVKGAVKVKKVKVKKGKKVKKSGKENIKNNKPEFISPNKSKMDYPAYSEMCTTCLGKQPFEYFVTNSNSSCTNKHYMCSFCLNRQIKRMKNWIDRKGTFPDCPICKAETNLYTIIPPPWSTPEGRDIRAKRRDLQKEWEEYEIKLKEYYTPPKDFLPKEMAALAAINRQYGIVPTPVNPPTQPSPLPFLNGEFPKCVPNPIAGLFVVDKPKKKNKVVKLHLRGDSRPPPPRPFTINLPVDPPGGWGFYGIHIPVRVPLTQPSSPHQSPPLVDPVDSPLATQPPPPIIVPPTQPSSPHQSPPLVDPVISPLPTQPPPPIINPPTQPSSSVDVQMPTRTCYICPDHPTFPDKCKYQNHRRIHKAKIPCPRCHYEFKRSDALGVHMNTSACWGHWVPKPYPQ